jgi:hypothetical protein
VQKKFKHAAKSNLTAKKLYFHMTKPKNKAMYHTLIEDEIDPDKILNGQFMFSSQQVADDLLESAKEILN